jgi:methyltransferase (TIGR00027 family)
MEQSSTVAIEELSAVSNTAFLTLWARSLEARSQRPILPDPAAIALTEQLRPVLAKFDTPFYRQLVADELPPTLLTTMALRARYFDEMARNFRRRFPRSIVCNLGAGLDTRFERLDDGNIRVIDIDLPPVIALKQQRLPSHPRHILLPLSVLDPTWMDAIERYESERYLFLAEGLLMYFSPAEVKKLIVTLATRFPGSELVADVFHARWVRPPWNRLAGNKMQRRFHTESEAAFHFGLDSPAEMETWHPNVRFVSAWSFFDANERKLGLLRWFRHFPLFRLTQYVVHYRFV